MFKPTVDQTAEPLDKAIADAISYLEYHKPTDPDYQDVLDKVQALYKLRAPHQEARKRVDPNTIVAGLFGIIPVLLILNHEQAHAITTKALSFVPKIKL